MSLIDYTVAIAQIIYIIVQEIIRWLWIWVGKNNRGR